MLWAFDAGCDYAGYFDADLATPLEDITDFVKVLDQRTSVQIVLGARVARFEIVGESHATTSRAALHLTYDGPPGPEHVFVKITTLMAIDKLRLVAIAPEVTFLMTFMRLLCCPRKGERRCLRSL